MMPPALDGPHPPQSQQPLAFNANELKSVEEGTGGRKRSGSNSIQFAQTQAQAKEVLNDLAHHSKKQLNALISRLGKDKDKQDEKDKMEREDQTTTAVPAVPLSVNTVVPTFSHAHSRSIAERMAGGATVLRDPYMPPGAGASGQGRPPTALKGVKLRREMEEAGERREDKRRL
jgi:hypothetical protein